MPPASNSRWAAIKLEPLLRVGDRFTTTVGAFIIACPPWKSTHIILFGASLFPSQVSFSQPGLYRTMRFQVTKPGEPTSSVGESFDPAQMKPRLRRSQPAALGNAINEPLFLPQLSPSVPVGGTPGCKPLRKRTVNLTATPPPTASVSQACVSDTMLTQKPPCSAQVF
jgi:hypothetical protein